MCVGCGHNSVIKYTPFNKGSGLIAVEINVDKKVTDSFVWGSVREFLDIGKMAAMTY